MHPQLLVSVDHQGEIGEPLCGELDGGVVESGVGQRRREIRHRHRQGRHRGLQQHLPLGGVERGEQLIQADVPGAELDGCCHVLVKFPELGHLDVVCAGQMEELAADPVGARAAPAQRVEELQYPGMPPD